MGPIADNQTNIEYGTTFFHTTVKTSTKLTDIMRLSIIIPSDNLHDIRLDILDGLLPAIFPQRIRQLDPVVLASQFLELRRTNTHNERPSPRALDSSLISEVSVSGEERIIVFGP